MDDAERAFVVARGDAPGSVRPRFFGGQVPGGQRSGPAPTTYRAADRHLRRQHRLDLPMANRDQACEIRLCAERRAGQVLGKWKAATAGGTRKRTRFSVNQVSNDTRERVCISHMHSSRGQTYFSIALISVSGVMSAGRDWPHCQRPDRFRRHGAIFLKARNLCRLGR